MQILVDASVWLDYFTGKATPEADHLNALIGNAALVVADVVLLEVLQGLPDENHRRQAREALGKFWLAEISGFDLAEKTAMNYHALRARGVEVDLNQCRIATFCLEQGFELLHSSDGYEALERHLGLRRFAALEPVTENSL
ncbi:MAG: PIN domain-containing protein [Thermoanaerobaculia bacterium]